MVASLVSEDEAKITGDVVPISGWRSRSPARVTPVEAKKGSRVPNSTKG